MKPCISQATTLSTPFEADLSAYARGGWTAVELWLTKLETYLETHTVAEARALLDGDGLEPAAAASQGGLLLSRGAEREAHWDHFRRRLAILHELGVPTLVVAADFNRDLVPDDYPRAAAALAEAAEAARAGGRPAGAGVPEVGAVLRQPRHDARPDPPERRRGRGGLPRPVPLLHRAEQVRGPRLPDAREPRLGPALRPRGHPRELAGDGDRILPGEGDFQIGPILDQLGGDRLRGVRLARGAQPAALADRRRPGGRPGLPGPLPDPGALARDRTPTPRGGS